MSVPVRVLVVDDSIVVRRLVSEVISSDPELTVVGTASNGKVGLARIEQLSPDIVTLDVEMPELDGLATLAQLRKTHPKLPVIMFSTLTHRAASATIEALSRGANDYVAKPDGISNLAGARDMIRATLLPKLKALCGRSETVAAPARPARPVVRALQPAVRAIVVGVSTGGPPALATLVNALPADLPVPVFIVQHMPPVFTTMLARRLAASARVPVVEAAAGMRVQPGHVYLAPGDFHLTLASDASGVGVALTQTAPENSCRPSVDVLFRSALAIYGDGLLATILTGMGQDGLRGCELVRERGGAVVAQDQATSVVWGMPGAVVRAGVADTVLPIEQIAGELVRRVGRAARRAS